jgi:hypothetical protein
MRLSSGAFLGLCVATDPLQNWRKVTYAVSGGPRLSRASQGLQGRSVMSGTIPCIPTPF